MWETMDQHLQEQAVCYCTVLYCQFAEWTWLTLLVHGRQGRCGDPMLHHDGERSPVRSHRDSEHGFHISDENPDERGVRLGGEMHVGTVMIPG